MKTLLSFIIILTITNSSYSQIPKLMGINNHFDNGIEVVGISKNSELIVTQNFIYNSIVISSLKYDRQIIYLNKRRANSFQFSNNNQFLCFSYSIGNGDLNDVQHLLVYDLLNCKEVIDIPIDNRISQFSDDGTHFYIYNLNDSSLQYSIIDNWRYWKISKGIPFYINDQVTFNFSFTDDGKLSYSRINSTGTIVASKIIQTEIEYEWGDARTPIIRLDPEKNLIYLDAGKNLHALINIKTFSHTLLDNATPSNEFNVVDHKFIEQQLGNPYKIVLTNGKLVCVQDMNHLYVIDLGQKKIIYRCENCRAEDVTMTPNALANVSDSRDRILVRSLRDGKIQFQLASHDTLHIKSISHINENLLFVNYLNNGCFDVFDVGKRKCVLSNRNYITPIEAIKETNRILSVKSQSKTFNDTTKYQITQFDLKNGNFKSTSKIIELGDYGYLLSKVSFSKFENGLLGKAIQLDSASFIFNRNERPNFSYPDEFVRICAFNFQTRDTLFSILNHQIELNNGTTIYPEMDFDVHHKSSSMAMVINWRVNNNVRIYDLGKTNPKHQFTTQGVPGRVLFDSNNLVLIAESDTLQYPNLIRGYDVATGAIKLETRFRTAHDQASTPYIFRFINKGRTLIYGRSNSSHSDFDPDPKIDFFTRRDNFRKTLLKKGFILDISRDESILLIREYGSDIVEVFDVDSLKSIKKIKMSGANEPRITDDKKYIISVNGNTVDIKSIENEVANLKIIFFGSSDWVVTHSSGLFDASAGAMDKLHFVQGLDVVEFMQLKERYYEPGLWKKIMSGEPLRNVAGMRSIELPPDVHVGQVDEKGYLPIELTNKGGGIGAVTVFINGKEAITDARTKDANSKVPSLSLKVYVANHKSLVKGQENLIGVKAWNEGHWVVSRGGIVSYRVNGNETAYKPAIHIIACGVSDYTGVELDLKYAAKDAEDVGKALTLGAKNLFGTERSYVYSLTTNNAADKYPSKLNILKAFEKVSSTAHPLDIVVVYLSGHGINHGGQDGDWYYLTQDAYTASSTAYNDPDIRRNTTLSSVELVELFKTVPALKQVLMIDACASGKLVESLMAKRDIESSTLRALDRMRDRTGLHIITGCTADAVSYEASKYGQGVLTYSLLEGIRGAALREDQFVDINKLFQYAHDRVPLLAEGIGGIQTPQIFSPQGAQSFDIGQLDGVSKKAIPISKIRPVYIRSTFLDDDQLEDALQLGKRIDDALNEAASKGTNSNIIFVDVREYPEGCKLSGRYKQEKGVIKLKLRKKCEGQDETIDIEGKTVDEIKDKILGKL
jgi:Caspase domain